MLSIFWREIPGNRLDTLMENYGIGGVGMVSVCTNNVYGLSGNYGTVIVLVLCGFTVDFKKKSGSHI